MKNLLRSLMMSLFMLFVGFIADSMGIKKALLLGLVVLRGLAMVLLVYEDVSAGRDAGAPRFSESYADFRHTLFKQFAGSGEVSRRHPPGTGADYFRRAEMAMAGVG